MIHASYAFCDFHTTHVNSQHTSHCMSAQVARVPALRDASRSAYHAHDVSFARCTALRVCAALTTRRILARATLAVGAAASA